MEYLYINGSSSVAIEKSTEKQLDVKVYIDGKLHKFEDDDLQDKEQYAIQAKRNKYQKFLSRQFENLIVLSGAGSSVDIGEDKKKGRLLTQLWDDVKEIGRASCRERR